MKNFYGHCIPVANLNHLAHHLVSENLKPIGLDPSLDMTAVLTITGGRLRLAKPEDREAALFLTIFDCPGEEMTIDEWCMFFCGYVVGEGLGLATCFALVNDKTASTRMTILICCVDQGGRPTPFHSLDQGRPDTGMASTSAAGED